MEAWRELAMRSFPNYRSLYEDEGETIWGVLWDLLIELIKAYRDNNPEQIAKIYSFAEWCYLEWENQPEAWMAVVPSFYEHLVDYAETYQAIPSWIKPELFRKLLPVFEHRLVNLPRDYGLVQPGSYRSLLEHYDQAHGTNFAQQYNQDA
jgi:hypothetical protein